MLPGEYEFLYRLEEKFWWFAGMRRITDAVIDPVLRTGRQLDILDAGCGTGFNVAHYSAAGLHKVFAVDISPAAIEGIRRRGFSKATQASGVVRHTRACHTRPVASVPCGHEGRAGLAADRAHRRDSGGDPHRLARR